MYLHFLVLQCTTNGANSSSRPLFSNLHAPRIILNPILTTFKWLQFGLILADFALTVLDYSTFPQKSVFIFGISMVELVCAKFQPNQTWRSTCTRMKVKQLSFKFQLGSFQVENSNKIHSKCKKFQVDTFQVDNSNKIHSNFKKFLVKNSKWTFQVDEIPSGIPSRSHPNPTQTQP